MGTLLYAFSDIAAPRGRELSSATSMSTTNDYCIEQALHDAGALVEFPSTSGARGTRRIRSRTANPATARPRVRNADKWVRLNEYIDSACKASASSFL